MLNSTLLILLLFVIRNLNSQSENTAESTTLSLPHGNEEKDKDGYIDMEIISIGVLPKLGNVVELSWGKPLREYNLDWTYGVYYGSILDEALKEPKLTTKNLSVEINDLSFCTKYTFGVAVISPETTPAHSPQDLRTIGTLIDEQSPPENLRIEFIPDEKPCLLMKWSASCSNIAIPVGYTVTVSEANTARIMIVTVPQTTSPDLSQTLRVAYGKTYNIKVATDVVNAKSGEMVSFKIPNFLQPYKVQITSQPDGTFVLYWREPYVPYYVSPYFYEIYVYPGRSLSGEYRIYETDKTFFVYRGNDSEYTFMVGLKSEDGVYESLPTAPLVKNLYEEAVELNLN